MSELPSQDRPRIADRLAASRRGRFVGRQAELDLFRAALLAPEPPFAVLHIHGAGGVGKTTLLREFARIAIECGRTVIHVDGRDVDPSPRGLIDAVSRVMGQTDPGQFSPSDWPANSVFILDTYEQLSVLDTWLRDTFLPELPAQTLSVVVGRNPPAPEWRSDVDWADLTLIRVLGNLLPKESQTYLTARHIPVEHHDWALSVTHGHPLALALLSDVLNRGDTLSTFDLFHEPEVVSVLLERLVRDIPTTNHRLALQVCTLARSTTETLLADALDLENAHDLFEWLRHHSFIEQGPYGLFPHDLAREVLEADFRWRVPQEYFQLSRKVLLALTHQISQANNVELRRLPLDVLFVLRTRPTNLPYFDWNAIEGIYAEPALPDDAEAIVEMVHAHEGAESAAIVQYWLQRQPAAFLVFRDQRGDQFGFMAMLTLSMATSEDMIADPAVEAALRFVQRYGPVSSDQRIIQLRYWMDRNQYQQTGTATVNLLATNSFTRWFIMPDLAWSFVTMADPDAWVAHFDPISFPRSPEADFEVGGRRYGTFAHDWRVGPFSDWVMNRHRLMPFADPNRIPTPAQSELVLTRADFANAVRQALRDYTRPDRLATNPLMRSRLVLDLAGQQASPTTLQTLLREAIATLPSNPKDVKFHRALWHTYIEPAATQEQVADLLGLPFNTYRYHLSGGVERVAELLWQRQQGVLLRP